MQSMWRNIHSYNILLTRIFANNFLSGSVCLSLLTCIMYIHVYIYVLVICVKLFCSMSLQKCIYQVKTKRRGGTKHEIKCSENVPSNAVNGKLT